ncbi:phage tail protein [Streptomyces fradiae]|uniref:phage tail protein n=1 Tax=Streptomyces fradiae TaxID=1906 RepID=UPI00294238BE|nr:phage tail protein [Streptomyces fradiae]WOI61120.1 phage tail protein [Streptomyces fradiae]
MTCGPHPATFRLLDGYVGWDETPAGTEPGTGGVTGFDDPDGIRLAHAGDPEGPARSRLLPWFPDPRLAPGCGTRPWYLLVPEERLLLRSGPCGGAFAPVWPPPCDPDEPRAPVSVAARGRLLAVVDADRVLVWDGGGARLTGVVRAPGARLAAFGGGGEVLVACRGGTDLRRYDTTGGFRGVLRTGVRGDVLGLRTGPGRTVWLLTGDGGRLRVHRGGYGTPFREATPEELAGALRPSALTAADEDGFCRREDTPDGPVTRCHTWRGLPRATPPRPAGTHLTDGSYVTALVDSGISRCRWHRVRVDADVPPGTSVSVALVVTEDGRYEDADWQTAAPGAADFLVDQPPGRYLRLRLRLTGDGAATPVVRRVRLDFPRSTSADLLPPAFRQDPAADDFTERFLSLFDAALAELDRVVERYPALLDADGVPDRVLPWLAGLMGLSFESGWDARTRRALLAAAPELYRRRGTPWALTEAVRIVFGAVPVVEERTRERRWAWLRAGAGAGPAGAVLPAGTVASGPPAAPSAAPAAPPASDGGCGREAEGRGRPDPAARPEAAARPGPAAGLGAVRLFGRSASRFRVGGSALGAAPLRAFGDPDDDPLTAHAHRFRVLLPAGAADPAALRRLVERQAPAHTAGSVRTGAAGFVVGSRSVVGVDTAFVPLPPPVLGGADTPRLGHDAVLRPGPAGARRGVGAPFACAVGVHTRVP